MKREREFDYKVQAINDIIMNRQGKDNFKLEDDLSLEIACASFKLSKLLK